MAFENSNPSSTPVVAQSSHPPDLAAAMPAINGSMVSALVVITQAGLLDDNMDTNVDITVRSDLKKDKFISDLDVDLLDDDVVVNNSGVFPKIRFSDRFHQQIDVKLSKSLIVRLLGRSIGYRALKNRVLALWRPMGEVSIVDLENDYHLIRFAVDADYDKVLTGGPWMVYDCYLTVQPWSRSFSTLVTQPNQILAWIRLPGLPYRYYSKILFRAIAELLGHVVRVDLNTDEGARGRFVRLVVVVNLDKPLVSGLVIDGMYQAIEYEGLPVICFGCGKYGHTKDACGVGNQNSTKGIDRRQHQPFVDDRFVLWMQVVNRRRRPSMLRKVVNQDISAATGGSRFNVLNVEDGDNHQSQVSVPLRETNIEPRPTVTPSKDPCLVTSSSHSVQQYRNVVIIQKQLVVGDYEVFAIDKPAVGVSNSMERGTSVVIAVKDKPALEVSNSMECDASVVIAAKDTVVSVPSSLKPDKHKFVHVIEEAQPRVLKNQNGRQSYGSIRSAAAKGTMVVDWTLSLSRSLSKEGELVSKSIEVPVEKSVETSNGGV
ncbi:hypothetical protein GQ457_14G013460 [Hibiscus cannabinus]